MTVRQTETPRMEKAVSVADYIVDRLAAEGINHCFGVAGDYVFPICNAVDSSAKVKWIGCANELNASYAADGYAIRRRARRTQEQFADALGIPANTVRSWEQRRKRPSGAARTLLRLIEQKPELWKLYRLQQRNCDRVIITRWYLFVDVREITKRPDLCSVSAWKVGLSSI